MNKKGKITASIAAVAMTVAVSLVGLQGDKAVELEYELIKGDKVTELKVEAPETVDIVELYCNDSIVTKTVLPTGTLKSIPLVFSDLENLELKLYDSGELAGVANFKDDKLILGGESDE